MRKETYSDVENINHSISVLSEHFGTKLSLSSQDRERHAQKISTITGIVTTPAAIIYPRSTAEVQHIISICKNKNTPIVCFPQAEFSIKPTIEPWPCICLDLTRLKQIIAIDSERQTATVEYAVSIQELNEAFINHRLYFKSELQKDTCLGFIAQLARTELINKSNDIKITNVISTVNLNNNGKIEDFVPTHVDLNCITEVKVKLNRLSE